MKKYMILAVAAVAALGSCTKDTIETTIETPSVAGVPTFTASIENSGTRTTLGEGNKVDWEDSDELFIRYQPVNLTQVGYNPYAGGDIYAWIPCGPEVRSIFNATPDPSDPTIAALTFSSFLEEHDSFPYEENYTYQIQAVYPASLSDSENPGVFVFPATQTFNGDRIGFAPMYYSGRERAFVMQNTASILAVTVPASQMASVKSITVSSDQSMNGYCDFLVDVSENPVMVVDGEDSEESKTLTLICDASGSNTTIDGSRTFYICVPVNHYDYLQIDVTDGTTTKTMRTMKASGIDVARNMIYPVTFEANVGNDSTHNGHEYVDLGLPSGIKWATMNVGADAAEDKGGRYAWGETETKASYSSWATYKYSEGSYNTLTKYCYLSRYGYESFKDDKRELELEDDAANANWGGDWRMPTHADFNELRENSTQTAYQEGNTEFQGIAGFKFQSNVPGYTDKWIFFPAPDANQYYWTSTLSNSFCYSATYYQFTCKTSIIRCDVNSRYNGYLVRAVLD